MELGTEVKPSFRRKHVSKMRDIKVGTKRLDKLMNSLLNMQTAFKTMISEVPIVDGVVLALGASPLRPQHIYVLNFSSARLMMILRGSSIETLAPSLQIYNFDHVFKNLVQVLQSFNHSS
ncbi:hypothetical protein JHK82_053726 [Glycine max]|nr:hypothetical protein JHK82_053726 [Glycine max]